MSASTIAFDSHILANISITKLPVSRGNGANTVKIDFTVASSILPPTTPGSGEDFRAYHYAIETTLPLATHPLEEPTTASISALSKDAMVFVPRPAPRNSVISEEGSGELIRAYYSGAANESALAVSSNQGEIVLSPFSPPFTPALAAAATRTLSIAEKFALQVRATLAMPPAVNTEAPITAPEPAVLALESEVEAPITAPEPAVLALESEVEAPITAPEPAVLALESEADVFTKTFTGFLLPSDFPVQQEPVLPELPPADAAVEVTIPSLEPLSNLRGYKGQLDHSVSRRLAANKVRQQQGVPAPCITAVGADSIIGDSMAIPAEMNPLEEMDPIEKMFQSWAHPRPAATYIAVSGPASAASIAVEEAEEASHGCLGALLSCNAQPAVKRLGGLVKGLWRRLRR